MYIKNRLINSMLGLTLLALCGNALAANSFNPTFQMFTITTASQSERLPITHVSANKFGYQYIGGDINKAFYQFNTTPISGSEGSAMNFAILAGGTCYSENLSIPLSVDQAGNIDTAITQYPIKWPSECMLTSYKRVIVTGNATSKDGFTLTLAN